MVSSHYLQFKLWIRRGDHPVAGLLKRGFRSLQTFEMPVIYGLHSLLGLMHQALVGLWQTTTRMLYFTPLLRTRCTRAGKRLYLYGGLPFISGPLQISLGDDCRLSGQTTFSARSQSVEDFGHRPRLIIGNNVDIGWQTTIATGTEVRIGNHSRIAGRAFLAGYPGHPEEPLARSRGEACLPGQSRPIILEDNVWLGTGVTVTGGVRIGENSIVAAGSVVTRSMPSNVLIGGNPARVLRPLRTAEAVKTPDRLEVAQ